MSDDWTQNSLKCYCGRVTDRVVETNDLGEHIRWICSEHGQVGEFVRLNEGELDLGLVEPKQPPGRLWWAWVVFWAVVVIALFVHACFLVFVVGDSRDDSGSQILTSASVATTPPTVWQTTNLPIALSEPAVVEPLASRGPQIQLTEPPVFDPVAFCNDLEARDYRWTVLEPAMDCYRVVASWYGWTDEVIEARSTFVFRIMAGESAGCWNARRASWPHSHQESCSTIHTGVHDDVGFGQITAVLRPLTCEKAGICSTMQTIESPWNSMLAYVVVLDELGKRPWCYNRNLHVRNGDCGTWPG